MKIVDSSFSTKRINVNHLPMCNYQISLVNTYLCAFPKLKPQTLKFLSKLQTVPVYSLGRLKWRIHLLTHSDFDRVKKKRQRHSMSLQIFNLMHVCSPTC